MVIGLGTSTKAHRTSGAGDRASGALSRIPGTGEACIRLCFVASSLAVKLDNFRRGDRNKEDKSSCGENRAQVLPIRII